MKKNRYSYVDVSHHNSLSGTVWTTCRLYSIELGVMVQTAAFCHWLRGNDVWNDVFRSSELFSLLSPLLGLSQPLQPGYFFCLAAVRVILIFFFRCFHDPSDLRGGVEMLTQPRTPGDLSIRCRAVGQSLTQSRLIGCRRLSAVDSLLLHSRLPLDKKKKRGNGRSDKAGQLMFVICLLQLWRSSHPGCIQSCLMNQRMIALLCCLWDCRSDSPQPLRCVWCAVTPKDAATVVQVQSRAHICPHAYQIGHKELCCSGGLQLSMPFCSTPPDKKCGR